ncbi:hypothetical protein [Psychrobacter jeotgali]|uniref:hypothetical protein n=1 Tax=Psychrobacter jeotgali TaxID=179010 RepID=UPI001917F99E|nr:hypothetical protein [Psychrobacter jeotgali]
MKDYKWLLVGIVVVLLIILLGIFVWLWTSNQKNIDPLPIMVNDNGSTDSSTGIAKDDDESDAVANSILYLQAEETLKTPLNDIINRFESRYPSVQVSVRYVPSTSLINLPAVSITEVSADSEDISAKNDNVNFANKSVPSAITIDIIIADDTLNQTQLSTLQALLDHTQSKRNAEQDNSLSQSNNDVEAASNTTNDSNTARSLTKFSYAIKNSQAIDGVILTDHSAAVSFRNFLLSSAGQDILEKYDYNNIDGYKNSMDDLFNESSRAKANGDADPIDVTDILSNSE